MPYRRHYGRIVALSARSSSFRRQLGRTFVQPAIAGGNGAASCIPLTRMYRAALQFCRSGCCSVASRAGSRCMVHTARRWARWGERRGCSGNLPSPARPASSAPNFPSTLERVPGCLCFRLLRRRAAAGCSSPPPPFPVHAPLSRPSEQRADAAWTASDRGQARASRQRCYSISANRAAVSALCRRFLWGAIII